MNTESFEFPHFDTDGKPAMAARKPSPPIVPARRDAIRKSRSGEDGQTTGETLTELQLAEQRLQNSELEIQMLANVISHDLRTPLRAISGFAQYLKEEYEGKLDETAESYVDFIVDGAVRMDSLIHGLILYSRISSTPLPEDSIEISDLLTDAISASGDFRDETDIVFVDGVYPKVRGDFDQLTMLFQNLIENGLKFNDSENPEIQIQVKTVGDLCQIQVCDNGIGISPQHIECVFDLFRRLNVRSKFAGEGAGLAICRRIAEHHSGELHLESEKGLGTTAILSLPCA